MESILAVRLAWAATLPAEGAALQENATVVSGPKTTKSQMVLIAWLLMAHTLAMKAAKLARELTGTSAPTARSKPP